MNRIILTALLFLTFVGCAKDDRIEWPPTGQPTEGRTLIYYMVCDNDLTPDIYKNLMQVAGVKIKNPDDRVVAFIDHHHASPLSTDPQVVQFDGNGYHRVLKTYPEGNSCDPVFFREILDYIIAEFPSQSYGLVLSSHGSGWSYNPENTARSFGGDMIGENGLPIAPQFINIKSLAQQLPMKFDFILFDACLMAQVEVAYELKDKADFLLASPITIDGKGFAYDSIQSYLLNRPTADLKSAADWFYDHYGAPDNSYGAIISIVDLSQMGQLAAVQRGLFEKYGVTGSLLRSEMGLLNPPPPTSPPTEDDNTGTDPEAKPDPKPEEPPAEEVLINLYLNGTSFKDIPYYDEVWANRYNFNYLSFIEAALGENVDPVDLNSLKNQLNKTVIYNRHSKNFYIQATVNNERFQIERRGSVVAENSYQINTVESSSLSTYIPFAPFFDNDGGQYTVDRDYYKQLGWYAASGMDRLFAE